MKVTSIISQMTCKNLQNATYEHKYFVIYLYESMCLELDYENILLEYIFLYLVLIDFSFILLFYII
jgi:hypothetical protein